jgi:hypothetical protein
MSWNPNDSGQGEFLRSSDGLRSALSGVVERIKSVAEATAPVGDPASDPHPGQYRDSFRTEVSVGRPAKGQDRLIGHVYNDAPHAAAVEYGYSGRHDSPGRNAHHTLTYAIQAARE